MTHVLHVFDASGVPLGSALRAAVERTGTLLWLRWDLGAAREWVVPGASPAPARRDRLSESTCLEAFLTPVGQPEYWELNLSPSGDWNLYRFDDYRRGMRQEPRAGAPAVRTALDDRGTLTFAATLDLAPIAELASAPLDVGITAVLESIDGRRSYWASDTRDRRPTSTCARASSSGWNRECSARAVAQPPRL